MTAPIRLDIDRILQVLPHRYPFVLVDRVTDVVPNERFVDETAFAGVVVRVTHAIAPQSEGGVRVTYRTEVEGPGAAEIGAGVSADFPDVLAALKRLAEAGAPAR